MSIFILKMSVTICFDVEQAAFMGIVTNHVIGTTLLHLLYKPNEELVCLTFGEPAQIVQCKGVCFLLHTSCT